MQVLLVCFFAIILLTTPAWSQSLNPETPAPLQPGINQGTIDNFVGTHYWYLTGLPGHTHIHFQLKPMSLLGNPQNTSITFTLSDEKNTWHTTKVLSSDSKIVDGSFDGDLKQPTKLLISIAPPSGGLVRTGGDYQLEATGAVSFTAKSAADPIIGMYKQMSGYTTLLGDCKFLADGNIQTTSGPSGKWQLFDKDTQTYIIDIEGQDRHSLQYVAGRGLCSGGDIVFQQLK